MEQVRIALRLLSNRLKSMDEPIHIVFGFRFRRLDHDGPVHHEREVNGGG